MIREVIEHSAGTGCAVAAGNVLAIEKHIFGLQCSSQIGFGDHAGRHVPVERTVGGQVSVRFAHAVAISVVSVGVSGGAGEAVLLVEVVAEAGGSIVGHIPGGVILPAASYR